MTSKKHPWFRPRRYLHFDPQLGSSLASIRRVAKIVSSPEIIASHSFYPFINYEIKVKKIAEDKSGKLRPKIKSRPIAYASHIDSQIYGYYSNLLSKSYEQKLNQFGLGDSVLAFRSLGKSNIDFAFDAFEVIKNSGGCEAIAFDISGFFDNLNHNILKKSWAFILGQSSLPRDHYSVFKSLTKFSKVDKTALYKEFALSLHNPIVTKNRICTPEQFRRQVRGRGLIKVNCINKGIPQGSPISALLSNIYMFNFDVAINDIVREVRGHYYRYCDDMLFILPKEFSSSIEETVRNKLKELEVDINPKKTEIRSFRPTSTGGVISLKPLQYLGFTFDGQRILLRSASLARYSERMKKGVALARATKYKRDKQKVAKGLPKTRKIYKRQLYEKYSHLGSRNFISYGLRAAGKMKAKSINRQLKPLWKRLHDEISK